MIVLRPGDLAGRAGEHGVDTVTSGWVSPLPLMSRIVANRSMALYMVISHAIVKVFGLFVNRCFRFQTSTGWTMPGYTRPRLPMMLIATSVARASPVRAKSIAPSPCLSLLKPRWVGADMLKSLNKMLRWIRARPESEHEWRQGACHGLGVVDRRSSSVRPLSDRSMGS